MNRKFARSKKNKNCKIEEDVLIESLEVMFKLCGEDFNKIDDNVLIIKESKKSLLSNHKLTKNNHLLFINGCLQIVNLNYDIRDDYLIDLPSSDCIYKGDNIYLFFK